MAHLLGDRLIPKQPLWVDRGILHVGPTKSLTFSPGDLSFAKIDTAFSNNHVFFCRKIIYPKWKETIIGDTPLGT